jgi:AraC family transcriptional regulator, regulatory protein of adaptative response / methylated-DNA-[protein]-cysteine methyltransferase
MSPIAANTHTSTARNTCNLPPRQEMYSALVSKDVAYEGVFVAAIKTTGIFCRSSCHARKPNQENVEYFSTNEEALTYGFRPCKVCKPLEPLGDTPDWVKSILQEVSENPDIRFKDQNLRERGIEPTKLRRWFKRHHGITFQAYLRALRLNQAIGQIKQNNSVTKAAFDIGYESLSGFNDAFKKLTGLSPVKSKQTTLITVSRVLTPLGPMIAGVSEQAVCLLEFSDRRMLETQFKRLVKLKNAVFAPGKHPLLSELKFQLDEYFAGKRKNFNIPLDFEGTKFQQLVWQALIKIPVGETKSYQAQAEAIGRPKATRAVAKANGDNRIAIIIPCHRVVGKNGSLTGYGGGLWRKQRLLELEQNA